MSPPRFAPGERERGKRRDLLDDQPARIDPWHWPRNRDGAPGLAVRTPRGRWPGERDRVDVRRGHGSRWRCGFLCHLTSHDGAQRRGRGASHRSLRWPARRGYRQRPSCAFGSHDCCRTVERRCTGPSRGLVGRHCVARSRRRCRAAIETPRPWRRTVARRSPVDDAGRPHRPLIVGVQVVPPAPGPRPRRSPRRRMIRGARHSR